MLSLIGASLRTGAESGIGLMDSAALVLFIAGAASLAMAGFLLAKAPKAQGARLLRRR